MSEEKDKGLEKETEKWLGRGILVKYIGFAVFGICLALIILGSVLNASRLVSWSTWAMIFGLALICVGVFIEKVLG